MKLYIYVKPTAEAAARDVSDDVKIHAISSAPDRLLHQSLKLI